MAARPGRRTNAEGSCRKPPAEDEAGLVAVPELLSNSKCHDSRSSCPTERLRGSSQNPPHWDQKLLPARYFLAAFQYYRERFHNCLFIVITEPGEYEWCRQNLARNSTDVIVADDKCHAQQDFALLSTFKHFIYSFGTFGILGIFLSNAKTVVYPHAAMDGKNLRYFFIQI
ncbi:galactoside 2-alpha-L-fucosyltransferase SEC1 [Hyalella azteca]|uniref:L-Fucosyltransferase n=1 Tax=Hyalella azteca TaxID=294128 RepID=A0A8B7N9K8_HYAAZ|nr:galactoside 2-alpha-L-fucosyltransferase SEC1 [Hyalella azteca]